MAISDIYYEAFYASCQLGHSSRVKNRLYIRWQDQLKDEGKFYVYGKRVVAL